MDLLDPGREPELPVNAMTNVGMRYKAITAALVVLPTVAWVVLISYYLRAGFALGHLPRPFQDDPKGLGFAVHHSLSVYAVVGSAAGIALVAALSVFLYVRRSEAGRSYVAGAVATGVFLALHLLSPVVPWCLD